MARHGGRHLLLASGLVLLLALPLASATDAAGARHLLDSGVAGAVIGGSNAPKRYDWMVNLRPNGGDTIDPLFNFCGGSLIHPRVVLTAAHCVINDTTGELKPRERNLPLAYIGNYDKLMDKPGSYERRRVVRTVAHPQFEYIERWSTWQDQWNHDVALLLLDAPSSRRPVALPPQMGKPKLSARPNTGLKVMGWGRVAYDPPKSPMILQQATLQLQPLQDCDYEWYPVAFTSTTNTMLCAGNKPWYLNATCQGDSGGPLFQPGGAVDGRDLLIGATSWGPTGCTSRPNVYTNVAQLRDWIDATIEKMLAAELAGWVRGNPTVRGFDGSKRVQEGKVGAKLNILQDKRFSLGGVLQRAYPTTNNTVLGSVTFKWADEVFFEARASGIAVRLNKKVVKPGGTLKIRRGTLRYAPLKPRANRRVTLQQPGVTVTATQRYFAKFRRYATWLDVEVALTRQPLAPVSGVLARGLAKPTGVPPLLGSIAAQA